MTKCDKCDKTAVMECGYMELDFTMGWMSLCRKCLNNFCKDRVVIDGTDENNIKVKSPKD